MIAAMDETDATIDGAIAYIVAATVIIADETTTKAALSSVLDAPGRKRPFHWAEEGPKAKERMIDCLLEVGAVAHVCVHHPTGRKAEAARARSLHQLIPRLIGDGATDLLIESRDWREDLNDRAVILDILRTRKTPGALTYEWHDKTDPLVWLPDAVCGAVRAHLLGTVDQTHYDRLCSQHVIDELIYINDTFGPGHA